MSKNDPNKEKLRVYEYAKQLNMSSKEILKILDRLSLPVANHMSVMENDSVDKVESYFRNIKENAAVRRAQEQKNMAAKSGSASNAGGNNKEMSNNKPTPQNSAQAPKPNQASAPSKPAAQNQATGQAKPASPAPAQSNASAVKAPAPSEPAAPKQEAPAPAQVQAQATPAPAPAPSVQVQQQAVTAPAPAQASQVQPIATPASTPAPTERTGEQAQSNRDSSPRPPREGGYQGNQGGAPRPPREGGYQGNRDGAPRPPREGGGYQGNRDGAPRPPREGGGYQGNRDGAPRPPREGGGYQGNQGGAPRPPREGGGYQGNRDGAPRPPREGGGGYQGGAPRPGGYQGGGAPRPGGYQGGGAPRPGGYQGGGAPRTGGGGGYNKDGGGFNKDSGGFNKDRGPSQGGFNRDKKPVVERKAPPAVVAAAREAVKPKANQPTKYDRKDFLDDSPAKFVEGAAASAKKKNKANQKRFDDNKSTVSKPGVSHKAQKLQQRGRHVEVKEKVDTSPKKIVVRGTLTVSELASAMHKTASELVKKLFVALNIMATVNQELDLDTIQLLATEYGVEVELKIAVEDDQFENEVESDEEHHLQVRPPVVTIMGHVDHGKTTLLDAIRSTNVTAGEAGGITQHIGAYQVEVHSRKITFLDTPGHEAFTMMRARGSKVTDITILVVAADDGVMPQTVEAVHHAKAAGCPIIVAVNKIDKPGANPDKVMQELTEHGLVAEKWGGDTIFVEVSAKKRLGLEELLEMILLVSDVQDWKANPDKRARGTVLEAELDKGRGPVARVLIQNGTLKVGDAFVAGVCFGRVRAMVNDKGRRIKEAGPSTPVEITGLTEVPRAGDPLMGYEDERKARTVAETRSNKLRASEMTANTRVTLDDLHKFIKQGEVKDLNVIIKGDVQGSVEALRGSLAKIEIEGVRIRIIHYGAGAISESDVILAAASNAIVFGFNVRPDVSARSIAEQEKVDIRLHRVIYDIINEIEAAMKGMLEPVKKEVVLGQAEIRNLFKVTKVGTIAGCMVTSGKITRHSELRLIRGGIVVHEGKIDSLKRFKDDVKDVAQGYECGISFEKYNDLQEGDVIEAFIIETVART